MAIKPSEARLWRLLARGYFPSELPPPFQTDDFAKHSTEFAGKWDHAKITKKFWTKPEHFSSPRYGHARRKLSIVNPINQLVVSAIIANNWFEIRKRLKRSSASEFNPKITLKGNGRAVTGVDFDAVARRRAEILSTYGRYVRTDIARFYPSIYTHSIAWAIFGKSFAKNNHKTPAFKSSFGNFLDYSIGAGQEGQTMGIPIDPDTSRIISEIVAVEIEAEIQKSIPDWTKRVVRYVDDMIIGIEENESESNVLSKLSAALYEYELELNAAKTQLHGLGKPHAPEWIHFIRNFSLSPRKGSQRDDLDSYFEHAIYLSDENPQENVLLFACKRACSLKIEEDNLGHLVRWLLYCCRRAPSCLRFVSEYLAALPPVGPKIGSEISDFILHQIPRKAEAGHTEELAWLLFWAREINLSIPDVIINECARVRSSVVAMIVLDLRDSGKITGVLDEAFWRSFCDKDGLQSELWLVSYEATMRQWWSSHQNDSYISAHDFFSDLHSKSVTFYDRSKKAKARRRPIFQKSSTIQYLAGAASIPTF